MNTAGVAGVLALNLAITAVGLALLWGFRTWTTLAESARVAGLAYFVGLAALVLVLTFGLTIGVPISGFVVALAVLLLAVGGLVSGLANGQGLPSVSWSTVRLPTPSVVVVAGLSAIIVLLEVAFREARLQPLWSLDNWWVWTIRAKALYFTGELGGASLVRDGEPSLVAYPPGLSLVHAMDFMSMRRVDTVTLHVQHWLFAVAFVWAILGLLATRVRAWILMPTFLFALVMPAFIDRINWALADVLLAFLVSLGALLLYTWLAERQPWALYSAVVLLAGAVVVKREGIVVVACALLAAFVATWPVRSGTWRQLGLAVIVLAVVSSPWRLSLIFDHSRDAPTAGYGAFADDPGRGWESLKLMVNTFSGDLWMGFGILIVVAVGLAAVSGARTIAAFSLTFLCSSIVAWTFVYWSETSLEVTQDARFSPVIRMVMVTVVVLVPLTILCLERAWQAAGSPTGTSTRGESAGQTWRISAWAIIGAAVLLYPAAAIVGVI